MASALAVRLPRADEHSSIEFWNPVLKVQFLTVVPDVGADPCDDFVPVAACVPELRDARGFFRELVSDSLADDGFADRFLQSRSDVAISSCARAGDLERGPGGRSRVPVGSAGGSLEQLDSELILPFAGEVRSTGEALSLLSAVESQEEWNESATQSTCRRFTNALDRVSLLEAGAFHLEVGAISHESSVSRSARPSGSGSKRVGA